MQESPKYFLKAFRAIDNREESLKFFYGHAKVLTDYGIKNLNTAEPGWLTDPGVYVINAYDHEEDVVGGLRVHLFDGRSSLPVIDALKELDPKIQDVFDRTLPEGTAEVCGLWNAKKIFGKGISPLLCVGSVVLVSQLKLNNFFCFSAPYTEKMIKTNGLVDVTEIGRDGKFNYPTEEFVSTVLFHPDVERLEHAQPYNRERIKSLITCKSQVLQEKNPREEFLVSYELAVA
ncbi:MAG: hypothetical protein ACKOW8_01790 [Flavobacteriales bacterium]